MSILRRGLAALALLPATLFQAGCSVTALAEKERSIAVNSCDETSDCGEGADCVSNQCLAPRGSLSSFLFEVAPTVLSGDGVGRQFFKVATNVPSANGSSYPLSLNVATIQGRVRSQSLEGCSVLFAGGGVQGMDLSIPARVTFIPRAHIWGITTPNLPIQTPSPQLSYEFRAQLPAGDYDVYVEPLPEGLELLPVRSEARCSLPPVLYRQVTIEDGATILNLSVPQPSRLDLEVRWPSGAGSADDWVVDMLDAKSGRVISTRAHPTPEGARYTVALDYVPVSYAEGDASEIVRLSPPPKVVAPSLLFQRAGLGLFSKNTAVIDQLEALPPVVSFEGRVTDSTTQIPLQASLTFIARQLDGVPPGIQTSFIRKALSDQNGDFELELLPGTYVAQVTPLQLPVPGVAPFAASELSIKVAPTPQKQAGRVLVLERALELTGRVLLPNREAGARGAQVTAEVSSSSSTVDDFARALGELPLTPRAVEAVVNDPSGEFTLYAEPGTFDLSVRPAAGSSLAWLVRPHVDLATLNQSLELQLPQATALDLSATLRSADPMMTTPNSLIGALVRAYALLGEDGAPISNPEDARAAVAVGEGRLDENARVTLLLPARLDSVASSQ